jgi:hypothetical protein
MKHILIIVNLLFIVVKVNAQTEIITDSIDSAYDACIENDPTTVGAVGCDYEAQLRWNSLIEKYYKLLMDSFKTEPEKASLTTSRKLWTEYFNNERQLHQIIFNQDGSMWPPVRSGSSLAIVKTRALQLIEYYDTLNQH